ncbi:MAG: hypothetical protein ABSG56_08785 [Bryobacteraceae bacterium]|jgi:hypothetical protein
MLDIKPSVHDHRIKMRTTLDVENDVLDAARALAAARGVSVGAAFVGTGAAWCRGPHAVERTQRLSGISSTGWNAGFRSG